MYLHNTFKKKVDYFNVWADEGLREAIKEQQEIEKQLVESGTQVSNLEKCIDTNITYASKLNTMWNAGDYNKNNGCNSYSFLKECLTIV